MRRTTQGVLFDPIAGPVATDPGVARTRALMEEIPRYSQATRRKGRPVPAGVVANVVQVRKRDQFGRWRREIESHGYRTRWVALNSMHVTGCTRNGQYLCRCPHRACRHPVVEPGVLPAATVIDWTLPPGQRIGERVDAKGRPPLDEPLPPAPRGRPMGW